MIYLATLILAFCSIVYELLLGQILSAFLGNTVLRYSVTIGLYMSSMGVGALLAEGRFRENPLKSLILIELALTAAGGFSIVLLFALSYLSPPALLFSSVAHGLIILIGILTGFEIPLLIYLRNREQPDSEGTVLGVDYLGAFTGTIAFASWMYPSYGIVPTAFLIGSLNGVVGFWLCMRWLTANAHKGVTRFAGVLILQICLLAAILTCLSQARGINRYLVTQYLETSGASTT